MTRVLLLAARAAAKTAPPGRWLRTAALGLLLTGSGALLPAPASAQNAKRLHRPAATQRTTDVLPLSRTVTGKNVLPGALVNQHLTHQRQQATKTARWTRPAPSRLTRVTPNNQSYYNALGLQPLRPTVALPYVQGFESVVAPALPAGITRLDANNDGSTWTVYDRDSLNSPAGLRPHSGQNEIGYFYNTNGTTPANDWIFLPAFTTTAGTQVEVKFWWAAGYAAGQFWTESMEVKRGNAPTVAAMTSTLFSGSIADTVFQQVTTSSFAAPAGNFYIGFHVNSTADQFFLNLDDITVQAAPACPAPTGLAVSNVTGNSATATFSTGGGNNFTVEYGPTGYNPATGGTNVATTTGSANLTGLAASTTYDVYVTRNCGAAGTSVQVGPVTFTTTCLSSTVTTFPYVQGFETAATPAFPCGVTRLDANNDGSTWKTYQADSLNSPAGLRPHSGFKEAGYFYNTNGTTPANDWIFLPAMSTTAGTQMEVKFWWAAGYAAGQFWTESMEVKRGNAPTVAAMTSTLFSGSIADTVFQQVTTSSFAAPAGNFYIGFHVNSTADQFFLNLDDITVQAAPACPAPTTLAVGSITSTSATATFSTGGGNNFTVEYGPTGYNPATGGTNVATTTGSANLTGLTGSTTYDVYVTRNCGAAGTSVQVGPVTFTTLCGGGPVTLPYSENFDGTTGVEMPCGWTVLNLNGDTIQWRNRATSFANTLPHALSIRWTDPGVAQNDWAITPGIVLTSGQSVDLSFNYRNGSATFTDKLEVKVGTSPTAAALTTQIFNNPAIANPVHQQGTGTFVAPAAGTYYFGFHAYSDPDMDRIVVDDVVITASPTCPAPTQLAVTSVTGSTATVTFAPGTGNNFTVLYGPTGFNPATGGTSMTTTTGSANLTGLTPSTSYDVYVTRDCGAAGMSTRVGPVRFSTTCLSSTITTFPYLEGFESAATPAFPCGITRLDANNDGSTWKTYQADSLNSPAGLRPHSGIKEAGYFYNTNGITPANDWIFLPAMSAPTGSQLDVKFWWAAGYAAGQFWTESMEVKWGTAATPAAMTNSLFSGSIADTVFQQVTTLPITAGAAPFYIGFHVNSTADQFFLNLDDISVELRCQVPVLTAGGPTAICPGGSVALTVSGGGTGATYQFLLNGSSISGATGTTYTATQAGTYTVRATAGACITTSPTPVTVTINAVPTAPTAADVSRCGAGAVTLTASGAGTGGSYQWYTVPTGGTAIAGATAATYTTPSLAATTTYYVSAVSAAGCEGPRTLVNAVITPLPAPTIAAGGPTTFCPGGSVVLTASGGGTGATYQFTLNGAPIAGATTATYTATQAGTYSVEATTGTCSGTAATPVTVTVTPTPSAAFAYNTSTFCLSGTNPTPAITGAAGGLFSATGSLVINPLTGEIDLAASVSGTYTVTYAVSTPCPASASQTVTLTTAPSAAFTYPTAGPLCAGAGSTLTPTLATGASAGSYASAPAGMAIDPVTGVIDLSTSQAGTYTVTNAIAASGSCSAASATATVTIEATPVVTLVAGGALSICQGDSVALTATGGGIYQFLFNGQPVGGTGANQFFAAQSGAYSVIVTNAAGCQATSAPVNVTVNALPTATLTAGGATTFCAGDSVTLTATGGVAYQFTLNGTPIPGATGAIYVASQAGTYGVTVTNASGCSASAATVAITVNPVQSAAFSYGAGSYCLGGTTTSPVITGTPGGTFSSTSGLTLDATTGAINLTSSTAGTYVVTYTTSGPCAATTTQTVTLTTPQAAGFAYPAGGVRCAGAGSSLLPVLAPGATAGTFSVTPATGLGLNPATGEVDLSTSVAGTYTVTNTVAAAGACPASSATATVTITAAPTATLTVAGGGTICQGDSVTLTAAGGGSYQFNLNGTLIAGATSPTLVVTQSGVYTVTVTNGAGCQATSAPVTVTVNTAPAQPTIAAQLQPSGIVILTSSATTGNQWYLNGVAIPGATGNTYAVTAAAQNGTYSVTSTGANGCVSPRAANELVSVTGTAALLPASAAQLVPNPTLDGWATLELAAPALAGSQLSVFDATGRLVAHSLLASGATSHGLDLRALPRGLYVVRLSTPAGVLAKRLMRD